jgi:hypothetical protein
MPSGSCRTGRDMPGQDRQRIGFFLSVRAWACCKAAHLPCSSCMVVRPLYRNADALMKTASAVQLFRQPRLKCRYAPKRNTGRHARFNQPLEHNLTELPGGSYLTALRGGARHAGLVKRSCAVYCRMHQTLSARFRNCQDRPVRHMSRHRDRRKNEDDGKYARERRKNEPRIHDAPLLEPKLY